MKQPLIIKSSDAIIKAHSDYCIIMKDDNELIVAYKHISVLYLNQNISIDIPSLIKLSKNLHLQFIDHRGNILAYMVNCDEKK